MCVGGGGGGGGVGVFKGTDIHSQEQDTGSPSLENRGWWVKHL